MAPTTVIAVPTIPSWTLNRFEHTGDAEHEQRDGDDDRGERVLVAALPARLRFTLTVRTYRRYPSSMVAPTSRTSRFTQSAGAMMKRGIGLLLLLVVLVLVLKFAVGMVIGAVMSILGISSWSPSSSGSSFSADEADRNRGLSLDPGLGTRP